MVGVRCWVFGFGFWGYIINEGQKMFPCLLEITCALRENIYPCCYLLLHIGYDFGLVQLGYSHDAEYFAVIGDCVCIDHHGRCIGRRTPELLDFTGKQGINHRMVDFGRADMKLLILIDGHHNILLGFCILGTSWKSYFHHIRVGECGDDKEEHEQDKEDIIQGVGENF